MSKSSKNIQEGLKLTLALPLNIACLLSIAGKSNYDSFVAHTIEGPCHYDMDSEVAGIWNIPASSIVNALSKAGFNQIYEKEIQYLSNSIDAFGDEHIAVTLLNKFSDLPFLHPHITKFAADFDATAETETYTVEQNNVEGIPIEINLQSHIANLAHWRAECECISQALKSRGCIRSAKQLSKALKHIDAIWELDLGEVYSSELNRTISHRNSEHETPKAE